MDIYTVLATICVVAGCSIFLGHALGYRRGIIKGRKQGLNSLYARRYDA